MKTIETSLGSLELSHPTENELPILIKFFASEDLDLRRLEPTSHDSYASQGREAITEQWEGLMQDLQKSDSGLTTQNITDIATQASGIVIAKEFPTKDSVITDPFNLAVVEKAGLKSLQLSQLDNILTIKKDGEIICAGRVLPVEGSWELVSLITHKKYRGQGLATALINTILKEYKQRPLFSFQKITLVPYYLKVYADGSPTIPPFEQLPTALQRDLMYMNAFWGPNCIIRINKTKN
jgi:ribosomal protein S18 acetylase RimI-like enzyme